MTDQTARRHALAFNAVAPALKKHDQWLPLSVRKAVAEAVLAAVDSESAPPDNSETAMDAANNSETEPLPEFTEISKYRHDHGHMAWAWRCWGDGSCDGWLGLDHETERWARVTLQRHLREDHGQPDPGERTG